MGKYYRYRVPYGFRKVIIIVEFSIFPIVCYQVLRTIFLPTTLDVFLCCIFIGVFIMFRSKWI
ncbi:hypothetical protein FPQ13_01880 [Allobacillus salarius]|uniref:Uncharacterized protein n=1 Tax=Allobacillus salarius TaxID=1955272 RepID=A0A556PTY3_9BACI|nr:hypothetical protein FPQ13_01880 [Allobacillus salarius]